MREIRLTKGKVALVDDEDFEWAIQFNWRAHRGKQLLEQWYAVRNLPRNGAPRRCAYMHREIAERAGIELSCFGGDHRDSNGLNNQRSNLRPASQQENNRNCRKRIGASSQYKGVSWHSRDGRWESMFTLNGRRIHLGYFQVESDAAIAYDRATRFFFGEFSKTNFCYHGFDGTERLEASQPGAV